MEFKECFSSVDEISKIKSTVYQNIGLILDDANSHQINLRTNKIIILIMADEVSQIP